MLLSDNQGIENHAQRLQKLNVCMAVCCGRAARRARVRSGCGLRCGHLSRRTRPFSPALRFQQSRPNVAQTASLPHYYWGSAPNPAAPACYQHTLPSRPSLAAAAASLRSSATPPSLQCPLRRRPALRADALSARYIKWSILCFIIKCGLLSG